MADLHVSHLRKAFNRQEVLRDVSLSVASGTVAAILGASGSGKTTLLRLICGFEQVDAGTITIGGQLVAEAGLHVPPERRRIGYVAQEGALFPHLSVADNIGFGLPWRQRRRRYRVGELLELVGLPPGFADRAPQTLSGGEQQRVALARALAPSPRLVLLDEPFSALDAALRSETRGAVAAALAAANTTAVLVTHDQDEALSLGQTVAVLRQGAMVQVADPVTIYRQPADSALAQFVGEAVILAGIARDGHVSCALGTAPVRGGAFDGAVEVLIRPEQIRIDQTDRCGAGTRARVLDIAFFGHDARVGLHLLDTQMSVFTRVPGHLIPDLGAEVCLILDGDLTVFPVAESFRSPATGVATRTVRSCTTS